MPNRAKQKYGWQRRSAIARGIDWQLTFDEWYKWWLDNGIDKHTDTMPMCKDKPVMCRKGDTGPYSLSNIYCATSDQNRIDALKNNSKGFGHIGNAFGELTAKPIMTPAGLFSSRKEAAQHYNIDPSALNYRMARNPTEYYYIVVMFTK